MAVERAQLSMQLAVAGPHQGRRGRPGHLPHPGLTPLTDPHADLRPEPPRAFRRAPRRIVGRVRGRDPRHRVPHAQGGHRAVLRAARRRAWLPPRPARSPPRSTRQGITYELRNNGTALAVEKAQVAQARVALAAPGRRGPAAAPRRATSCFDKQKLGASEFQQQVTYQRALEGEIARTINGVQGVSGAIGAARAARGRPVRRHLVAGHRRRDAVQPGRHAGARRRARHRAARRLLGQGPQDRERHDHRQLGLAAVAERRQRRRRAGRLQQAGRRGALRPQPRGLAQRDARPHARAGQGPGAGQRRPQRRQDDQERAHLRQEGHADQDHRARPRSCRARARPAAARPAPAPTSRPTRRAPAGGSGNSNYNDTTRAARPTSASTRRSPRPRSPPARSTSSSVALLVDKSVPPAAYTGIQNAVTSAAGVDTTRGDTIPGRPGRRSPRRQTPKAGPVPTTHARAAQVGRPRPGRAALPASS